MIRRKHTAGPETTGQDDTPGPGAVPDDLAAYAQQLRAEAAQYRERADRCCAEDAEVAAAAEAEIDRIRRDAETRRSELAAEAARGEREAADREERAGLTASAVAGQAAAVDADRRVAGLEDERDRLAADVEDLDAKLARLAGDRDTACEERAAALTAVDEAAVTVARDRIASLDELIAAAEGQRAVAVERAEAVGDGENGGELAVARSEAERCTAAVTGLLDRLWPDRPGAAGRRAVAEFQATLEANLERVSAEAAAHAGAAGQRVIRL